MSLRELFLKALTLEGPERDRFVDLQQQADPALGKDLSSLLAAADGADDYCQNLAARIAVPKPRPAPQPMPERVGAYRPLKLIGQGGMGSVYLAERIDQHFEKQVAIKLLPASVKPDAAQRFVNERQILARLVHPNIARLLDGGLTDDQRPYFVMDYVDGQPIDAFCDHQQLTIDQRLRLFVQVCQAVQYAHSNLVLHRDLKPSNILVNDASIVHLLDFGVSEMLGGERGALSQTTQSPMTPAYASPEVIAGQPATTAADVYSLGVLLFRLVTGLHPFADDNDELSALLGKVLEHDPPKASERWHNHLHKFPAAGNALSQRRGVSTKRLTRQLTPDLDAVLRTALSRTPENRYQTAAELADDIEALCEQRPVRVIAPTPGYRLRRFCQRYRFPVALTAVCVSLLVALTVQALRFAVQTQQQATVVAAERDRSESLSRFLLGLFVQANPRHNPKGTSITAKELLDIGVTQIQQLREQPETQAALLSLAANAYSHMDLLEQAKPLFTNALNLQRQEASTPAATLALTLIRLARVEADLGNWPQGEAYAQEALAQLSESKPEGANRILIARSLLMLGSMRMDQGDYQASQRFLTQALQNAKQMTGPFSEVLVARILSHQGSVAQEQGQPETAIALQRQALAIRQSLVNRPTIDQADSLLRLGQAQHALGNIAAAETSVTSADAIHQRLLETDSAANAVTARTLGEIRLSEGKIVEAENLLQEAATIWRRISVRQQPELARVLASLGVVRRKQGQPAAARALLEESLAISESLQPNHWRTQQTREQLLALGQQPGRVGAK